MQKPLRVIDSTKEVFTGGRRSTSDAIDYLKGNATKVHTFARRGAAKKVLEATAEKGRREN